MKNSKQKRRKVIARVRKMKKQQRHNNRRISKITNLRHLVKLRKKHRKLIIIQIYLK